MTLRVRMVSGDVVVVLPSEVDVAHLADVSGPLGEWVWERDPPPARIIFDLTPAQFIDTPCLALITETVRRARQHGVGVRVVAPTESQQRLLALIGMDPAAVHPTLLSAGGTSIPGADPR